MGSLSSPVVTSVHNNNPWSTCGSITMGNGTSEIPDVLNLLRAWQLEEKDAPPTRDFNKVLTRYFILLSH